jgi:hypothetical protein
VSDDAQDRHVRGLGLRCGARLPSGRRPGSLGPLGSVEGLIQQLIDETPRRVGDPLHATLIGWGSAPQGVDLLLHPAEEPLQLRVEGEWLIAAAKTSGAGPGYHAFVVDLLDRIAEETGLVWVFDDEEQGFEDDTRYAVDRDQEALEWAVATWWISLARRLVTSGGTNFSLSLPLGLEVVGDHFAISPLGEWSRSWFERAATLDPATDPELAADWGRSYFPWWDRERNARFWLHAGLALIWLEVSWQPPQDPEDERVVSAALACLDRARELDLEISLPEAEIAELAGLREGSIESPHPTGLGFRRRTLRKPLGGGWSVDIPGYFNEALEREGTTIHFHDPTRSVRLSTFTFDGALPERPPEQDWVHDDGIRWGTAALERIEPPEGDPHWLLQGEMRTSSGLAVVSIGFRDEDAQEWALETWRSLSAAEE